MDRRRRIAIGMAGGLAWSVALLWIGARLVTLPVFTLMPTIMTGFLAPGLVMMAMMVRPAWRRILDDGAGAGEPPRGRAAIDERVLSDTTWQMVLALCVWPASGVMLGGEGPGVVVVLGIGFALARLAFWAGAHLSPPLRAFGLAATFCPTVLVALWALLSAVLPAVG